MKTYLIPIVVLLCTLFASTITCNAQNTINAFKQGSVWTETHKSMYEPDPYIYTYTIDGECNIKGRSCMQVWEKYYHDDKEYNRGIRTYLFTEGDKVFFVPTNNLDACYLLYDFGISEGETAEVAEISNYEQHGVDKYTGWTCLSTSNINSCGNVFQCVEIITKDAKWDSEYAHWDHDSGYWIKGIGYLYSLIENVGYIDVLGLGYVTNVVTVDGEVVFDSERIGPCAIEEVQLEQPTARYHLDGRRASSSVHGFCIENHRVVLR